MRLRNGEHGYGLVSKVLHWLTVVVVAAQFVVGWTMSGHDDHDRGRASLEAAEERFEEDLERREERAEAQGDEAEDRFDAEADRLEDAFRARQRAAEERLDDDGPSGLHVALGLTVLALGLVRLTWRRTTPLPPWAEHLSPFERRLEGWLEKALLALLVVVPVTGLLLVLVSDDWLVLHVTAQVLLLAAIAGHVGLVLSHTVVRRHRHLARML